jgi:hypothetical protein
VAPHRGFVLVRRPRHLGEEDDEGAATRGGEPWYPRAAGSATIGGGVCYQRRWLLPPPVAGFATNGGEVCYYRRWLLLLPRRGLLPPAAGSATNGGRVCYQRRWGLLLPEGGSGATEGRRRCDERSGAVLPKATGDAPSGHCLYYQRGRRRRGLSPEF